MILTIVILVLFALFWLAELISHVTKYRYGGTLSSIIWKLEEHSLLAHVAVGALVALLFTHLEFQLP